MTYRGREPWTSDIAICNDFNLAGCVHMARTDPISQMSFLGPRLLFVVDRYDRKEDCVMSLDLGTLAIASDYCASATGVRFALGVAGGEYVVAFVGTRRRDGFLSEGYLNVQNDFSLWCRDGPDTGNITKYSVDKGIGQRSMRVVASRTRPLFLAYSDPQQYHKAVGQDEGPAIAAVDREIGLFFSPSLIAYHEYEPTVINAEHGWIAGGGFKAGTLFRVSGRELVAESSYEYNDGTTKHTQPNLAEYPAGCVANDVFVGGGPSFTSGSRVSWSPEADMEYRKWHRGLPHNQLDFIENYTFWAPGIGLRAMYNPISNLVVTARGGFAYTVSPTMSGRLWCKDGRSFE